MAASFTVTNITTNGFTLTITRETAYSKYRVFIRLSSDTSDSTFDGVVTFGTGNTYTKTFTNLKANTSYIINVGKVPDQNHEAVDSWIGAKTFTTLSSSSGGGGTTTTYYYRCYDETNSTYLTTSTSTTSSSVTRPSRTGYTYKGYKRGTSWSDALGKTSYTGTGTSGSFTSTNKYIIFCYTQNSTSSSSWSWDGSYAAKLGSMQDGGNTSFNFSLSKGKVGYCPFTPDVNGTITVYTTGSDDIYGYLVNASSATLYTSADYGSQLFYNNSSNIYTYDDDDGDGSNFSYTYDVTANTTYNIVFAGYDGLSESVSGTLFFNFEPDVIYYYAKVSYNANGGSGAPSAHTASDTDTSVSVTLSSTKPTRSGYNFLGWSTNSSATSASYSAGGTYNFTGSTGTTTTTLYAVWQQITYTATVSYNANGGSGAPSNQSATETDTSVSITLSSTKPTRDRYNFLGWATSASATSATHQPNTAYNFTGSTSGTTTTLYAVWENKFGADNVYYCVNGAWKLCEVYYCNGSSWLPVKTYYGSGGAWKNNT